MKRKGFACLVSLCMILAFIPGLVFASGQTTTSGKLVILDRQFEIAPDITEREYVTNNQDLTAQQSGHVMEVRLGGNAQIIAGYNDYNIESIRSGSNWGMRKTTEQAQDAETRRKINVVGAVNGDFFDMSNGRPRGVLVMDSTVIQRSAYPCFYIDSNNVPHIAESSADLPDNVKEAVGGAALIVSEGQAVNAGDKTKNPRTCIGIKADNTVVIYMVDGRQAPLSIGMDYEELAQTMIDLGCVYALNLDGGGSSTFATQRAGDVIPSGNKSAGLTVRCSPSDGYERTVSSSLFVVSNAQSDGKFSKAIISPNNEIYTPGSEINFTAQGTDKSGAVAELPDGLTWKVNNTELGTIDNNGTFKAAAGKTGVLTVSLMNGTKEVGKTTVELRWPDKLAFTNSSVSLDFGETSDLSFAPTYQGREVHHKDGDFDWSIADDKEISYKYNALVETYGSYKIYMPLNGTCGVEQILNYTGSSNNIYSTAYTQTASAISVDNEGNVNANATVSNTRNWPNGFNDSEDEGSKDNLKADQNFTFTLGKFKNNEFIADENNSFRGTIKVTLAGNNNISGETDVVIGMEPYILMDFEDHYDDKGNFVAAKNYWGVHIGDSKILGGHGKLAIDEIKENRLWIRDISGTHAVKFPEGENGIVSEEAKFGNYAYKLAWDFTDIGIAGNYAADFGFSTAVYVDTVQPTKLGMWIKVPKELKGDTSVIKAILVGNTFVGPRNEGTNWAYQQMNDNGTMTLKENAMIDTLTQGVTTYFQYYSYNADGKITGSTLNDWATDEWTWIETDISSLQMPIAIQRGYTVRIVSPQNHTKGKGHILIDNLQMIYGTNTNDIIKPVIDSVIEKTSGTELKTAIKPEFTTGTPQFNILLSDSENTDKYATGIDANSIRVYIDGRDYTSKADVSAKRILFQTPQLTNGEHNIKIRVKDYYGNETVETYYFTVNDAAAKVASVNVVPQGESAEIGKNFTLNINNISSAVAEFVDSASVTVDVPADYGNAVKDDLSQYIEYGPLYEQGAEPVYSDKKITVTAKKKTIAEGNTEENGTIASISFPVPDSAKKGESFSYSVQGSYVISGGGAEYTFSQEQQTVSLSAEYNITAGQAIAGQYVSFKITDKNGDSVTKDIKIYNGETEITNPYIFNTAGRTTVYAVDSDGKRSWNTDIVVSSLGTDGDGSPYGIQNNGSKEGSAMRNITWISAIGSSDDKAVIKYGTSEDNLNITENGDSRLFTFVQTNSGDAYRLNSVSLSGLEPSTKYYYQVGDGEKWSDVLSFTTASANSDADTRFFIFGDIQTNSTANLADAISRVKDSGYDFGIQTGDAVDNVTEFDNWRGYLTNVNSDKLGGIDLIHTLGNHEYYDDANGEVSKGMFGLAKSSAGSYNSYEYGSMYIGVINHGGDILAALEEAKADISNTKCVWKALVMHEPVYGTESLMEEAKRIKVVNAIEEAGFDVVFSGDDHTYTRTYPMKADSKLDEGSRDGVVYYICGDLSGKDNAYSNRDMFAAMIPHNEYQGMYMSVDANSEKLVLRAYRHNGELLDSYTIARTDCEIGRHSVDENSIYDVDSKTFICNICNAEVAASDTGYTGKVKAKDDKGEVMLVNGIARTGWFTFGQDICHAGENGIIHECTTEDTATCLENGYLRSTCKCGEVYKGASTWSKGHTWDEKYVCTVCHAKGKSIENVKFDVADKRWEYTGSAIRPAITAKDGSYTLSASSDRYGKDAYKSYSNNINVGKGKVTFEGRGNYYGSTSVEFPIVPKSVETVTAGTVYSTSAIVKWDAAGGAGYYNVYMRASNAGWNKVAVTKETNAIIDNLTPNTKYSFIVESSADVDGETYNCLRWSDELSITTPAKDSNTAADQINSIRAEIGSETVNAVIKGSEHYLMLPASTDLTALKLTLDLKGDYSEVTYDGAADTLNSGKTAVIDVTKLTGKSSGNSFNIRIAMKGCAPVTLHIMKSQSIPSIHLTSDNAADAGREYVDAVKGNAVTGTMAMTGADGRSIYNGNLKQIKARGNSTFKYYNKKSYQIKLETGTDLLGKGENVKTWVLLAGYGDATQMHDKLIKDLAAALGMDYVANCSWVDLYYDGEYRGLYLLSEKNSVGDTGINVTDMESAYAEKNENYGSDMIAEKAMNAYGQEYQYIADLTEPDNITGGYLIERNLDTIDEICGFYTKQGSGFNVKSPEFAGKEAMKYISEYYQEFEDAVYSDNGYNAETGKYYYDYCDADSLVKVYLLQKLGYNVDGFKSSFYFYKDKDDKMYAGPVWDQEMAFGTGWNAVISADEVTYNYLEKALIKIPDFKQRVEEYYKAVFKEKMVSLLGDNGIVAGYYDTISSSAEMNYVLWPYVRIGYPEAGGHLWPTGTDYDDVVKDMTDWLAVRADKLDELYGDGTLHMHHTYVSEITKPATYDEEGIRTYTCSVCNASYTEVIPKLIDLPDSGGGGLIDPGTEPGETEKPGNSEIKAEVEVKQTETGKTAVTAEITEKAGSNLISEVISNSSEKAVLDATTSNGGSETAEITLPGKTLNDFAEKTDAVLVIKTDKAELVMDNMAVAAAGSQAGENKVTLIIETVKSDHKSHEIKIKLVTADGTIKDFKGGKVTVTAEISDNLKKKKLVCVYIDDNNMYHKVKGQLNKDGRFTFTTGHFSTYAIMAETDADKAIAKQTKALISDVKIKVVTKKLSRRSVKVTVNADVQKLVDNGFTVTYKFYKSTKKGSGYKNTVNKTTNTYTNTNPVKGKNYYKVKLVVKNADGTVVATTPLTQCKYGVRTIK